MSALCHKRDSCTAAINASCTVSNSGLWQLKSRDFGQLLNEGIGLQSFSDDQSPRRYNGGAAHCRSTLLQQQTMLVGMAYEQADIFYSWCDIRGCRSRRSSGDGWSF